MLKTNKVTLYIAATFLLTMLAAKSFSQDFKSDLMLVSKTVMADTAYKSEYYHGAYNNSNVMQLHNNKGIAAYNPLALTLKGSMFVYQHILSPQLSRQCPYEITCSNFSKAAIHEFGIVKGLFIAGDRIMRCNRISLLDINFLNIEPTTGKIIDFPSKYK